MRAYINAVGTASIPDPIESSAGQASSSQKTISGDEPAKRKEKAQRQRKKKGIPLKADRAGETSPARP